MELATATNSSVLEKLIRDAELAVAQRRAATSDADLDALVESRTDFRPFKESLVRPGISLIAEFKRRSPSISNIAPTADLRQQVSSYEMGGAAAVSVLTETSSFGGQLEDLSVARSATTLPLLRKDFIVDRFQLRDSVAAGADAVLLIVAVLESTERVAAFHDEASHLGLDCVVEVHTSEELEVALEADVDVIGINNRSFHRGGVVDSGLDPTHELMEDVPAGKTVVAESGISTRQQLEDLDRIGVDAVLIGEALMRAEDPESAARELSGAEEGTTEHRLP